MKEHTIFSVLIQFLEKMQHISFVVNFVLGILCLLHIILLIYDEFHPNLPQIEIVEKNLDEIEFPLIFKFCIFETKDDKNDRNIFRQLGYKDNEEFFMGFSKGFPQKKSPGKLSQPLFTPKIEGNFFGF